MTTLGRTSDASHETISVEQGEEIIRVEVQKLNLLLVEAVGVMRLVPVLSPKAWEEALLCPDGQIHDAASKVRCISVSESCYQPCTAESPRHCPAKDKERRGCNCVGLACAQICCQATPRDPEARYIWYTGSNQSADNPNHSTQTDAADHESGEARCGYRSLPLRLADPLRRFTVTRLDDVRPANGHEDVPSAALLLQLNPLYPDLHADVVAGDAGFGFEAFLHIVYAHLHARRVIDHRCHPTDKDRNQWATRGYDDHGRPVCPFGYALSSYGFDRERQRHKWCCDKACLQGKPPRISLSQVFYPPAECPFQADEHQHGKVINVGERFPDASILTYDIAGRKLSMVDPDMGSWSYAYDAISNLVTQTDARNCITSFTYDALNRLTSKSYGGGTVCTALAEHYQYDAYSGLPSFGGVTTNALGQRTAMWQGDSLTTDYSIWSYNNRGLKIYETKAIAGNKFTTQWTYNSANQVASMTYPGSVPETVSYAYNAQDVIKSVTGAVSYDQTNYNDLGQPVNRILGSNLITTNYTYFDWTDPNHQGGRLSTMISSGSLQSFSYTYDLDGNITSILDSISSGGSLPQVFSYDYLNRLTTANDATQETVTYDNKGNLNKKTPIQTFQDTFAIKDVTNWTWQTNTGDQVFVTDGSDTVVKSIGNGSNYNSTFYRSSYNLTDGKSIQLRFKVDNTNSSSIFTVETGSGGTYCRFGVQVASSAIQVQYWVDGTNNNPKTLIASSATNTWYDLTILLDDLNGFTAVVYQESNPSVNGSYQMVMPSGRSWRFMHAIHSGNDYIDAYTEYTPTSYYYDTTHAHQVTGLNNPTPVLYVYDANGNMTTRTVGAITYTLTYDAENHLTSISGGGSTSYYYYDADGNRVKVISGGTTTYYPNPAYEAEGLPNLQMTVQVSGSSGNAYTYRTFDNTTTYTIQSGDVLTFKVKLDSTNPNQTGGFDAMLSTSGALRSTGLQDIENHLGIHPNTDLGTHAYGTWYTRTFDLKDYVGQILSNFKIACEGDVNGTYSISLDDVKITNGSTTKLTIYSDGLPKSDIQAEGPTFGIASQTLYRSTAYYSTGTQIVAMRRGGYANSSTNGLQYILTDHLGSTNVVTNCNGANICRQYYTPSGQSRNVAGTMTTTYQFTGQRNDGDLYFYNARYYDPSIMRFVQPDDIIPNTYDPQSYDRYAYVGNNPINYTDPSGHTECELSNCYLYNGQIVLPPIGTGQSLNMEVTYITGQHVNALIPPESDPQDTGDHSFGGEAAAAYYQLNKWTPGWWNNYQYGTLTVEQFFGYFLLFEVAGTREGAQIYNYIMLAAGKQLFSPVKPGFDGTDPAIHPYCPGYCRNGLLNFMGTYQGSYLAKRFTFLFANVPMFTPGEDPITTAEGVTNTLITNRAIYENKNPYAGAWHWGNDNNFYTKDSGGNPLFTLDLQGNEIWKSSSEPWDQ